MNPVHGHVRLLAGADVLGWDELCAVAFAVTGVVGLAIGAWLTGLWR